MNDSASSEMDRRAFLKHLATAALALVACSRVLNRQAWGQVPLESLERILEPIRAANGVPALSDAFIRASDFIALDAVGVRQAARQSASNLRIDGIKVALLQLLLHRSGLPGDRTPDPAIWPCVLAFTGPIREQRRALIGIVLGRPPVAEAGTRMLYSNYGYTIAGAFAEQVTGQDWERLLRQVLFQPLGMTSAGFGPPGLAQPWGAHAQWLAAGHAGARSRQPARDWTCGTPLRNE